MRKSEITPEFIELSKKAKELGFPQDVEEGDWIWDEDLNVIFVYTITDDTQKKIVNLRGMNNYTLILSFSRCLEWLEKEKYGVNLAFNTFIWNQYIFFVGTQSSRAKTHHEAIVKAVIKILEEEQCKT